MIIIESISKINSKCDRCPNKDRCSNKTMMACTFIEFKSPCKEGLNKQLSNNLMDSIYEQLYNCGRR